MTLRKSLESAALVVRRWMLATSAPPRSAARVTRRGSPPNTLMWVCTQVRAARWSSSPQLPLTSPEPAESRKFYPFVILKPGVYPPPHSAFWGASRGPGLLSVEVGPVGTACFRTRPIQPLLSRSPCCVIPFLQATAFTPQARALARAAAHIRGSVRSDQPLAWHVSGDAPRAGPLWWLSEPLPPWLGPGVAEALQQFPLPLLP